MELFKLFGTIAVDNDKANKEIDETTSKAEGAEGKMSGAFKKIGAAVATYFAVDKIVDFGKQVVNAAATISAETSAFEQIMGDYTDTAKQKMHEVAENTGIVDGRLTGYMTSMTAKFKGLGYDIDTATSMAADGLTLAADASAFWDKSMDESTSALNSFINGSYEGGEAIGLFANDTQMAAFAVKTGVVDSTKAWANLDEATKQATRLEYAQKMFEQSGATGQAAKEADQYANVQANLTRKWEEFLAKIGEPILQNIVLPAMEALSAAVDVLSVAFQDAMTWIDQNKETLNLLGAVITGVTVAVGAFLLIINWGSIMGAATNGLNMVKGAFMALNTVMRANPIGLVVSLIAGLVSAFIYLWNTNEGFRNAVTGIWEAIQGAFSVAIEAIKGFFQGFIDFFSNGWNSISQFGTDVWNAISGAASTAWTMITTAVQNGINFVSNIITTVGAVITGIWNGIWTGIQTVINTVWTFISTIVTNYINTVKTIITTVLNTIKGIWDSVWGAIKTFVSTVFNGIKTIISTVFGAAKTVISTIINAIKGFFTNGFTAAKDTVTNIFNAIKNTISNVFNGAKDIISNVINTIKSVFTNGFNAAKDTVTNVFNAIKKAIETPINKAKDIVKGAIDKIKGFFNFTWSLPKLKLPHPKISGSFSLNPPSVPSFSIDWYAKAMDSPMLLDSPTIFGAANGKLLGGGEAGAEVVSGANTLMGMIRSAVKAENSETAYHTQRLYALLVDYLPQLVSGQEKQLVLDTGQIVGGLAMPMDQALGDIARRKGRGQ